MSDRIEGYALVGDTQAAGLIDRHGSLDWLCLPRFDSPACFASLLGSAEHGRWRLGPEEGGRCVERRYRGDTLVLVSEFEGEGGTVRVIDFMPPRQARPDVFRIVEGVTGSVQMAMEFRPRFDYGSITPRVDEREGGIVALAGPDALVLRSNVAMRIDDATATASFAVEPGEHAVFELAWFPSHEPVPGPLDGVQACEETVAWWAEWAARCTYEGPWREAVMRSLIALKALTFGPSGGIVAAPTTSLPEQLGGVRNWDYRYCWIRDATFTLMALLRGGYVDEAAAWREWLLRAVAGEPADLQIMYGPVGERRLTELELPWLPGYEGSRPVRIGNAAVFQRQHDVFGELMDAVHHARAAGIEPSPDAWRLQRRLLDFLEDSWREPDHGIWEVRGPRRHFTHSKVMAWVAFDRAVKDARSSGLAGPVERWNAAAAAIRAEVCRRGVDPETGAFVQSYGSTVPDASLLMIPLVGFLPAEDERVLATVDSVRRRLGANGLVHRYPATRELAEVDGLPPGEGAFLPCTFWLVDNLVLLDRRDEAEELFERLLGLRNDVGLLPEEVDPLSGRFLGNFPQAFTHVSLVDSAYNLGPHGPAEERGPDEEAGAQSR